MIEDETSRNIKMKQVENIQEQSFSMIGMFFRYPIFFPHDGNTCVKTTNVLYKEIFSNL